MWIPITIYIWLCVCIAVFVLTSACLVVFGIAARRIPTMTPSVRREFTKKVLCVWAGSLILGLGLCGAAQLLGVGPHIWVTMKNQFLYGVKGCPCKPIPSTDMPGVPTAPILGTSTTPTHAQAAPSAPIYVNTEWDIADAYKVSPSDTLQFVGESWTPTRKKKFNDARGGQMIWPIYPGRTKMAKQERIKEMATIPKDRPTVFVGNWDEDEKEELSRIKGQDYRNPTKVVVQWHDKHDKPMRSTLRIHNMETPKLKDLIAKFGKKYHQHTKSAPQSWWMGDLQLLNMEQPLKGIKSLSMRT